VIINYGSVQVTIQDDPNVTGWFEDEAEIRESYWQPRRGDIVADIGCHIGAYTVPALVAGARVYAIDPSEYYLRVLTGICIANDLNGQLFTVNEALAGAGGYDQEFREALDAAPYPEHHAPASASYTTLDELAQRFGWERLDWVKIDTEGAELGILQGGTETLTRFSPRLVIEDHTDVYQFVADMNSRERCTELLSRLGYSVQLVTYAGHLTPDRVFMVGTPVTERLENGRNYGPAVGRGY